ncbi:MAG: glutathione peroxidase [Rhodospirillaceae bacterium]
MYTFRSFALTFGLLFAMPSAVQAACGPLLDHTLATLMDKPQTLCQYQGKVLLVVNTASHCGYTPQYEGLEALYRRYRDKGLVVLGFPSNDFGGQEPGSNREIASFCQINYGVSFPMFSKTGVTSRNANPFYEQLGKRAGKFPAWNFHKYLIDRSGNKVASFDSAVEPTDRRLVGEIERMLAEH